MISMFDYELLDAELLADIVSVSKATLLKWEKSGKLQPIFNAIGKKQYRLSQLSDFPEIKKMSASNWALESQTAPHKPYSSIELFAGAGAVWRLVWKKQGVTL
jgi:DNA (cytosine-5)-methyltransferase 1